MKKAGEKSPAVEAQSSTRNSIHDQLRLSKAYFEKVAGATQFPVARQPHRIGGRRDDNFLQADLRIRTSICD